MFVVGILLKSGERLSPVLVQPFTHGTYPSRIDVVDTLCAFGHLSNKTSLLQYLEVLRYGRSTNGHTAGEFANSPGPLGNTLEDFTARRIPKGGQADQCGLCVSHGLL